jgi:hypothetical protein
MHKKPVVTKQGSAERTFFLKYTTLDRSAASSATITTKTATIFRKKYPSGHQSNL